MNFAIILRQRRRAHLFDLRHRRRAAGPHPGSLRRPGVHGRRLLDPQQPPSEVRQTIGCPAAAGGQNERRLSQRRAAVRRSISCSFSRLGIARTSSILHSAYRKRSNRRRVRSQHRRRPGSSDAPPPNPPGNRCSPDAGKPPAARYWSAS